MIIIAYDNSNMWSKNYSIYNPSSVIGLSKKITIEIRFVEQDTKNLREKVGTMDSSKTSTKTMTCIKCRLFKRKMTFIYKGCVKK